MLVDGRKVRPADTIRSVIFFGLLYLYLWRVVEPCLIYSCGTITNFPAFYKGWAFFRDCLAYPDGLLRYLCALGPQFFYYSWAGALVITGQAWALVACTGWLLSALAVPGRRLLQFVPVLLVLAAYARYSFHFSTITGSLAALLLGCLYVTAASLGRESLPAVAVYLGLSIVSYTVSAAAYLPFAALCAIYEVLYRRRYGVGLAYLLLAAILPYLIGVLVFHVSIVNAYTDMLPLSWQTRGWPTREKMMAAVYALYLLPIAMTLVWGLVGRVVVPLRAQRSNLPFPGLRLLPLPARGQACCAPRKDMTSRRLRTPIAKAFGLDDATRWAAVRWAIESCVLLAVAAGVAFLSLDNRQKVLLEVHHYACHRMWPEVLKIARRCPDNYTVMNAVNRALYHTGRLNRDMFTFLQHPDGLLLTGEDHFLLYWHKFDTLLDLGLMNLAEKNLTECMETFGEQPMILQRLALIDLAKGKIDAARVFLGALRKTLFFDQWANDYLTRLDTDPTLSGTPEIQRLRAQCLRKDSTALFYAKEPMLLALVEQGGRNRMAFEYLMAWYMLNGQLTRFVQNVGRLTEFGYTQVPPLYQEAAVMYAYGTRKPIPLAVSPEAQQRIEHFTSIYNRYGRDKDAAFHELAREYAGSYFFYRIYGLPQVQK